jgi:glycosyltransferase involved in cell wall biosynthesis
MMPRVSVVVSTLNRPEHIVACARTILANRGVPFEVIVVDQSDPEKRAASIAAVGDDPRLRWVGTTTRGLSVSRNIGVDEARSDVIAFTDDDCRIEPNWVSGIDAAFRSDPDLGMLFGGVLLRPEDRVKGYAAEFEPNERMDFHHRMPDIRAPWGVGANMSIRRAVIDRVGRFDESLGAGSAFHAGEDIDFTIRSLADGFKIRHTPEIWVTHLGVREGADATRLMRGYGVGLGATLAKHIRLGTPGALGLLAGFVAHHGRRSVANLLRGSRRPGFGLVASVLWGARRSYEKGVDDSRNLYV